MDDGGCDGVELGGGEDLEFELGSTSSFASSFLEIGEEAGCFGAAKNEVILAFAFGFFELEPAPSAALRFKELDILRIERMLAVTINLLANKWELWRLYGSKLPRRVPVIVTRRDSKGPRAHGGPCAPTDANKVPSTSYENRETSPVLWFQDTLFQLSQRVRSGTVETDWFGG